MKHLQNQYVIGIDYGTDSCRALVVDACNGKEMALGIAEYPRWKKGLYCNPKINQYRQHPLDYIESLESAVHQALAQLSAEECNCILGLTIDTTGSTPAITNAEGQPLALTNQYADDPDAMFMLWKDHTAVKEAEQINDLIKQKHLNYNQYSGGTYSSEWVWAKVLHVLKKENPINKDAYAWVEHCDWMSGLLTGNLKPETMFRSRCAAGHKAMWHEDWGLPSKDYLSQLHTKLGEMRPHLYHDTYTCAKVAGKLTEEWADRLGLMPGIAIGVSAIDAHMGAVGASVAPGVFVSIIGTSTCDIMVSKKEALKNPCIQGISSQVDGSVIPDYIGIEAGQAAFGDIFAWFKSIMSWPLSALSDREEAETVKKQILNTLAEEAEKISPREDGLIALDWMNGRRTPDANQNLKGIIGNLTLGSSAPEIYRSLVESTAFGLKRIIEHMSEQGLEIKSMNAVGGISKNVPFVMQILADVIEMPIKVIKSENACALGAAMFAAVVSGIHSDIAKAQEYMKSAVEKEYAPRAEMREVYNKLYQKYLILGKTAESLIK
ncbi:MAG: ribulokinase [Prevotella sp.]|jgi:L-ribulokinase